MNINIFNIIKKSLISFAILSLILFNFLLIYLVKGEYNETFIVNTFGIVFNKIDFSIFYRFFTMLFFVNNIEVFIGIFVLLFFMARYEYLQGHKRTFILIILGNLTAFIAQYFYLYKYKGYTDYTDLALSNAAWAILGGLVIILGKKWGSMLLIILLAYNFISIAIPEYSSFQVAHMSALICGIIFQILINLKGKIKNAK